MSIQLIRSTRIQQRYIDHNNSNNQKQERVIRMSNSNNDNDNNNNNSENSSNGGGTGGGIAPGHQPLRIPEFKLILVGDPAVRQEYIDALKQEAEWNNGFKPAHVASLGVYVHCLQFITSHGVVKFNIWDSGGSEVCAKNMKNVVVICVRLCIVLFCLFHNLTWSTPFCVFADKYCP